MELLGAGSDSRQVPSALRFLSLIADRGFARPERHRAGKRLWIGWLAQRTFEPVRDGLSAPRRIDRIIRARNARADYVRRHWRRILLARIEIPAPIRTPAEKVATPSITLADANSSM
jgi:hypothetical protein